MLELIYLLLNLTNLVDVVIYWGYRTGLGFNIIFLYFLSMSPLMVVTGATLGSSSPNIVCISDRLFPRVSGTARIVNIPIRTLT